MGCSVTVSARDSKSRGLSSILSTPAINKGVCMDKRFLKKSNEELQEYLQFKRRGYAVEPKKGKGAKYKREKFKTKFED